MLSVLAIWSCATPNLDMDTLIKNGTLIDGTGSPSIKMDLGIKGDKIVWMGDSHKLNI
jgi:N-acyl-D-amino-acid deacylase